MKQIVIAISLGVLISSSCYAADPYIIMSTNPDQPLPGEAVNFRCDQGGDWRGSLQSAKIDIINSQGAAVVSKARMEVNGGTASYNLIIPSSEQSGSWNYSCELRDRGNRLRETAEFVVAATTPTDPPPVNHPPVAVDDSASAAFATSVTINVPANDTDVDGNLDLDSVTLAGEPSSGSAVPAGGGTVVYTPAMGFSGSDSFIYEICDTDNLCAQATVSITVAASDPPPVDPPVDGPIGAHNTITAYNGPATCIECHEDEATEMLQSLHMQWSGPTPKLTNTNGGEAYGKGKDGINTFCTYAMSSKAACFSCHVRADGNDPAPVEEKDVDCLMCHNDTYQRTFVTDPTNTEVIVYDPNGIRPPDDAVTVQPDGTITKEYVFGKVETDGNYTTVADFNKMPAGTNMVNIARTVHLPTNTSCLRCHAKAGGGDWTKRGDMGVNSANATVEQDVHLAKEGADLSCVDCHSALNHKIAGRGIDLRQTEAVAPTCQSCHNTAPHSSSTLNRHAQGQVSCQVCHIREYAKGGATEMSRDWDQPTWNSAFCSGQGGFVGHEVKEANVKPDYVWFNGTSYVYNVGETIDPDENNILHMAKANGAPFDGNSKIVPIKRHFSNMPFDVESGRIIPPAIMWMFMTGDFDQAVQKGLEEQTAKGRGGDYSGSYDMYQADAEMLITHGVEPKSNAPSCIECHDGSGSTPDGSGMLPFDTLGYHQVPQAVKSCNLCHERKSLQFESMHNRHRQEVSCSSCHTSEPTGVKQGVCSSCHSNKSWGSEGHKKHVVEKGYDCIRCHTFS